MNIFSGWMNQCAAEDWLNNSMCSWTWLDESMYSWSFAVNVYILNCHCSLTEQYTSKINEIRPKLGRSCRCMLMLGHGYEPGVDFVLILQYSNVPIVPEFGFHWISFFLDFTWLHFWYSVRVFKTTLLFLTSQTTHAVVSRKFSVICQKISMFWKKDC